MLGIKLSMGYHNNNKASTELISLISKSIFEESNKKYDYSTQFYCYSMWWKYGFGCYWEKKHLCVIRESRLSFLYLNDLSNHDGVMRPIKSTCHIPDLDLLLQNVVPIASDEVNVNSCIKCGLAAKFGEEEGLSSLSFTWCP